ncbi:hypothetical protein [Sphingomonas sp.]|jgi:hypothetical protein|uniref:CIS tube protein n=1 Tax=Sphingomonas sp. TaxID=28214 RepID=UPI002E318BFA|nr:hypothetical protein [Sphingomonas sp.]HEX4694638.1 hypothetical protein [Sphingomonas sp.]
MERGLLANIFAIPPLIFRFQWNPDLLQERKRYKYEQANSFGRWGFDQTSAASAGSLLDIGKGLWEDLKEIGPLLTATRPFEAKEGEPREYQIEFQLDATTPGPMDTDDHFGGSIEPDLAVLRSFMYPGWDDIDVIGWVASGIGGKGWEPPCWNKPPTCTFIYGQLSFDCVMQDLDIKITAFKDDLSPQRAEVTVRLVEQTHSATPITDFVTRTVSAAKALGRQGIGDDFYAASPIKPIVDLFT